MQVEVHNLNNYPYKEKFRDQEINIPAKNFIKMELEEAIVFKGTMNPVERTGDGQVLPSSYKMIKIVHDGSGAKMVADAKAAATAHKCHSCGYLGTDKQDLHIHVKEEHTHQLTDPKVAKQMLK